MVLLVMVTLTAPLMSSVKVRGDQDITISFGDEDYLDENFQEMTLENTQFDGEASARIDEEKVDDVIATAEKDVSYPVWKVLLVVLGCALTLLVLVGAVILVMKSRNISSNEMKEDDSNDKREEESENRHEKVYEAKKERKTVVDHIRVSLNKDYIPG